MIAESAKESAASRAMAKPLKRGRACLNCRFLKIKCDGVKPICGACRKHPKLDDCEYSDGPGRSRTKVLEDTVGRLEARLHELEHPGETTPSVTLHEPYNPYHGSISKLPPSLSIPEARPFDALSPFSPTSTSSSLPSNRPWKSFGVLETKSEFREAALLPLSFGHPSRPTPAVLSAVYLWGVHLSQSEALLQQEQTFMTRALQHAATDAFGGHPDVIMHTLQAEVLLAYYLLRIGRFIEAKCHTATAVSLALGAGLHKTRTSNLNAPMTLGLSSDTAISLAPPQDSIEEGERINGFWAVLVLHKYITIALEPPVSVCGTLEAPGIQVDTPWPSDMSNYSNVGTIFGY
ncbi:hypothetical protein C0991_000801 [Blastosporella zonata]|nr:hypothetical protein C0991_000801 [Blastosporella zonata]